MLEIRRARSRILAALNQRVLDLIDAEIAAVRALRRDIDAGVADLEAGRVHEGEAVFEALLLEGLDSPPEEWTPEVRQAMCREAQAIIQGTKEPPDAADLTSAAGGSCACRGSHGPAPSRADRVRLSHTAWPASRQELSAASRSTGRVLLASMAVPRG